MSSVTPLSSVSTLIGMPSRSYSGVPSHRQMSTQTPGTTDPVEVGLDLVRHEGAKTLAHDDVPPFPILFSSAARMKFLAT